MTGELLYRQNELLIVAALFLALLIATELGFRLGRARTPKTDDEITQEDSTLQAAMMGLLALLLAFSFSMSESRFEGRRQLVLEESNAIGTAYLRSRMLPEPFRSTTANLLRDYAESRLEFFEADIDAAPLKAASDKTDRVQNELWAQTVAATANNPSPVPTGIFVTSVNEMIDIRAKRDEAREQHVPDIVFWLLFFAAFGTMGLVGYGSGIEQRRNPLHTVTVALIVSFVILVIIDLDRPRRGIILVSQQSMRSVRDSIK